MRGRFVFSAVLWMTVIAAPAFADVVLDPLHAFCYGTTSCSDNGTVTPVTSTSPNPPQFGFVISPGGQTGDFLVDILVPINEITEAPASYTVGGSLENTMTTITSATATQVSGTWTSGDLDTFLGISASPANPIDNPLSATNAVDPNGTTTGYDVFQADLGTLTITGNLNDTGSIELTLDSTLPIGSLIYSFLDTGTKNNADYVATANSGALFETNTCVPGGPVACGGVPVTVPEPSTLALFGSAVVALGFWLRRRRPV